MGFPIVAYNVEHLRSEGIDAESARRRCNLGKYNFILTEMNSQQLRAQQKIAGGLQNGQQETEEKQ